MAAAAGGRGLRHTELFGGAITAGIPAGFADVSTIRQVPDNQEAYLSTTGLTSLLFDLVERVHPDPDTDAEALKFHLADIIAEGDECTVRESAEVRLPNFPSGTPALTLHATTTTTTPRGPAVQQPPTTSTILLTLIRLVPQSTDILITVNIPHVPGESLAPARSMPAGDNAMDEDGGEDGGEDGYGRLVEAGKGMRDEVVESVCVRNWGLFGVGASEGEDLERRRSVGGF